MPLGTHKATLFGVAGVSTGGDVVLLHDQDYPDVASASITSGIDSTYGEYIFKFYNINPATRAAALSFQVNATDDAGGDYDTSLITSTFFRAEHNQTGADSDFAYIVAVDQAEGTAYQQLVYGIGHGADESAAGELHLFNPSSTTYVKHFYSRFSAYHASDYATDYYVGGYINTTTAIDDIQFKMSSGNFDGTIKMWGVKN